MSNVAETVKTAIKHHQSGDLKRAIVLYRQALAIEPQNPVVLHSYGLAVHQIGLDQEAIQLVKLAIKSNPSVPQFHNTIGIIYEQIEKIDKAIAAYRRAIELDPEFFQAWHNMAIAQQKKGEYIDAVECCRKAIAINPDSAEAYNTMGYSLFKQELYDEAIESFQNALVIKPDYPEPYNHISSIYNEQANYTLALKHCEKAIEIDPDYADCYNNLGIALTGLGRFDEAVEIYQKALQLDENFPQVYYCLARTVRDMGDCDMAIEYYKKAIQLKENYPQAEWNLALTYLLNGDLKEGFKRYKCRKNPELKIKTYPYSYEGKVKWDGSNLEGKKILVHYEQGFSDNIQFLRFLPMVKDRGGFVMYECMRPMVELIKDFTGIDQIIEASPHGPAQAEFDCYISIMDLPEIFETTLETIPSKSPYLYADKDKAALWSNRLSEGDYKVGIVWSGSSIHENDARRSCSLEYFAKFSAIKGVKLYSLQKGPAASQIEQFRDSVNITSLGEQFANFADTAAVIENLDLVISVDTAVLHLAGALGKTCWGLLPYCPDWRWMLNKTDSPWYPTMKLFRQSELNNWPEVFERVFTSITALRS